MGQALFLFLKRKVASQMVMQLKMVLQTQLRFHTV